MNITNHYGQPIGEPLPDWQPRPRPEPVSLDGQYCRLEPLSPDHSHGLYQALHSAEEDTTWTWLFSEPPADEQAYHQRVTQQSTSQDPLFFTIIDKQRQRPIGTFALMRIEPVHGVVEVGHVHFSPLLQRTALSTEAHWLLMRYVFETLGYRRYEWKCDSLNAPSRKAALRLGFQFEGIFRQAIVYKQRNRDTAWFSIIDTEWPGVDHAFRQWLAADNFTAEGVQRQSLAGIRDALV